MNSPPCGDAVVCVMRREQTAAHGTEWAVFRKRLDLEDVKRGAGNQAFSQRMDERRLVHHRAARSVDEICRRSHDCQLSAPNQVKEVGLRSQCSETKSDSLSNAFS